MRESGLSMSVMTRHSEHDLAHNSAAQGTWKDDERVGQQLAEDSRNDSASAAKRTQCNFCDDRRRLTLPYAHFRALPKPALDGTRRGT